MDTTLNEQELAELAEALLTPAQLAHVAKVAVRRAFLADLREYLECLQLAIDKQPTLGYASIEVPEVWLEPIEQVLVHRGLDYRLKPPPSGTNMATVTVRWPVDKALTPPGKAEPVEPNTPDRIVKRVVPRKCDRHADCRFMLHHRGACEP